MILDQNSLLYWLLVILALAVGLVAGLAYIAITDHKELKKRAHDSH